MACSPTPDLDAPLHVAARKKINTYRDQYANNRNITFMPAITSTSSRMHGEFLRLLFLQAHRETTSHFTAIGMPAQQHCDSFRFRRAAFYNGLSQNEGELRRVPKSPRVLRQPTM